MTLSEEWRPVIGYEGRYEVSSQGRVRSLDQSVPGPYGSKRRIKGRVLSDKWRDGGYPCVSLGRGYHPRVYWLVAEAFLGPRPPKAQVLHTNGDPADTRVENLRYGSASDNMNDMVRHGRHHMTKRTQCPKGHPYDEVNTGWTSLKRRYCRACKNARARASRAAS